MGPLLHARSSLPLPADERKRIIVKGDANLILSGPMVGFALYRIDAPVRAN